MQLQDWFYIVQLLHNHTWVVNIVHYKCGYLSLIVVLAIGAIFRRYAPGVMPLVTLAGICLDIPDVHSSVFFHCITWFLQSYFKKIISTKES
jgi:hypothetical protein